MKKHREDVLKLRKEQREAALKEQEAERERREKLQDSCPHTKVRSYACNADGLRLVKIFRFVYDFQYERCIPRVQRKTISCRSEIQDPNDLDGDGIDDVTGRPTDYSRWKFDTHYSTPYDHYSSPYDHYDDYANEYSWRDGYMKADDFHGQKQEKVAGKNLQAQKGGRSEKPEAAPEGGAQPEFGDKLTPEEEQELKGLPEGPSGASGDKFAKAENPGRLEGPESLDMPEAPAPRQMSRKQPDMHRRAEMPAPEEAPMAEGGMDSADSFDGPAMKKSPMMSLAAKKKPAAKTSNNTNDQKIETQSKDQIDKLNQHLGSIESKVQEITAKYEELKKSDQEKD